MCYNDFQLPMMTFLILTVMIRALVIFKTAPVCPCILSVYNNMPLCIIVAVELFPSSVMTQENYQVELDSGMYHSL